jgi:hypothetical protein
LIRPDAQVPYSWQTSIGVQRQISETIGVNADYVYEGQRHNVYNISNTNLNFNAATGLPLNYLVPANNPYPNFGIVAQIMTELASNYHALQTSLNKRFSNRWQASATYTMAFLKDSDPCPPTAPANVSPGFCGEYGYATTDQRHRAVFNGIWQLPYDIQLSGLYLFGSGQRFATSYGQDLLNSGQGANARIRPNLTIVPRNNFVGKPIHRVDMRVQKKVRIIGRTSVDGIFELFNVINHENYGAYVTSETAANVGAPSYVGNIAYVPRTAQLGFRITF